MSEEIFSHGGKRETYQEFVSKFEPKKTPDDCYTPPEIYAAVLDWAVKEYGWENCPVVRPFYPGGDYEAFFYPENCVVIDNPPFSCISKIVRFYERHKIDYFLFAPGLTLFSIARGETRYIVAGCRITYENGACVNTGFVCSKGPKIRTAPELNRLLKKSDTNKRASKRLQYMYPVGLVTATRLEKLAKQGISLEIDDAVFIGTLDMQKPAGRGIYGGGALIAPQIGEQIARLDQPPGPIEWKYSKQEQEIIDALANRYRQMHE